MASLVYIQLGVALFTAMLVVVAVVWVRSRELAMTKQISEVLEAVMGLRTSLDTLGSLREELVAAGTLQRSAHLPPAPSGLPRRVVSVTGDDDPAHTRPTVPTAPHAGRGERGERRAELPPPGGDDAPATQPRSHDPRSEARRVSAGDQLARAVERMTEAVEGEHDERLLARWRGQMRDLLEKIDERGRPPPVDARSEHRGIVGASFQGPWIGEGPEDRRARAAWEERRRSSAPPPPAVAPARGTPTEPSAGVVVVSLDEQIEARYGALLEEAAARGEAVAHCGGLDCWEGEPGVCICGCEGCGRAAGLLAQATRGVTGERVTPG